MYRITHLYDPGRPVWQGSESGVFSVTSLSSTVTPHIVHTCVHNYTLVECTKRVRVICTHSARILRAGGGGGRTGPVTCHSGCEQ